MQEKTRNRLVALFALLLTILTWDWSFSDIGGLDTRIITLVLLIGFFHLAAALWVRSDAKKRDVKPVDKWMLAVIVPTIGIFGLVAYLNKRKRANEK